AKYGRDWDSGPSRTISAVEKASSLSLFGRMGRQINILPFLQPPSSPFKILLTIVTDNVTYAHPAHERAPFARALSKDGAGAAPARGPMHSAPGRRWASRPAH